MEEEAAEERGGFGKAGLYQRYRQYAAQRGSAARPFQAADVATGLRQVVGKCEALRATAQEVWRDGILEAFRHRPPHRQGHHRAGVRVGGLAYSDADDD